MGPGLTQEKREHLTVVIPCYNEEESIAATIASVNKTLETVDLPSTIVMVDDGSSDDTVKVMTSLCEQYDHVEMMVNEKNLGVGRTVLNAYERLDADTWMTVVPGDNEIIFDSIHQHLKVRDQYDLILGYFQNTIVRSFTRRVASDLFSSVVRIVYGFPYRYLNGLKLYKVGIFKGIEVTSSGHAFNAELVAKAILRNPGLRIGEVPFLARGRAKGSVKAFRPTSILRAVKEFFGGYRSVIRYRKEIVSRGDL